MKKFLSVLIAVAFVGGLAGSASAQATGTMEKKSDEKKMDKMDKAEKKASTKSANGTVKSASADSIVVAGKEKGKEAEWTFAVDPAKTKIKKGGKDITAADLKAGDSVTVRYAEQDGKATAHMVNVRAAKSAKKMEEKSEKKMEGAGEKK